MFTEPEFWVAVAFFIFVGIVWYVGGFKALSEGVDHRAKRIQAEMTYPGEIRVTVLREVRAVDFAR